MPVRTSVCHLHGPLDGDTCRQVPPSRETMPGSTHPRQQARRSRPCITLRDTECPANDTILDIDHQTPGHSSGDSSRLRMSGMQRSSSRTSQPTGLVPAQRPSPIWTHRTGPRPPRAVSPVLATVLATRTTHHPMSDLGALVTGRPLLDERHARSVTRLLARHLLDAT